MESDSSKKELRRERHRLSQKRYYYRNKQKALSASKKWREQHPEKMKQIKKLWNENNRERRRITFNEWLAKNKEKIKNYQNRKYKNNIKFKLKKVISSSINTRLRRRRLSKKINSISNLLPFTIDDLIEHLEKKFRPGMSWDNYGEWHIDHINPDYNFKYESVDDKEFKACWSLDNLQPLWAEENLRKSKYTYGNETQTV